MILAAVITTSAPAFAYNGWTVSNATLDPTLARGNNDPNSPNVDNLIYAPTTRNANSDYLVLFLAGSGGEPAGYTDFMHYAADQGFYVMGLDYLSGGGGIPAICGCQEDCLGHFYQQLVHGDDNGFFTSCNALETPSCTNTNYVGDYYHFKGQSSSTFASDNSIEARFMKVQNWAFQNTASTSNGGIYWSLFQNNGAPNWQHIIVAGHSRGSDVATWILNHRPAHAALGFAAVDGYLNHLQPVSNNTSLTYLAIGDGGTALACSPHASSPNWVPDRTATGVPYPNLYLFDANNDGNFNPDNTDCFGPLHTNCVGNDQYKNSITLGWTGSSGPGGVNSTDRITSCTSSTVFTSNWIVDNTGNGNHHTMINTVFGSPDYPGPDPIGGDGRSCVWHHMLDAAAH